ncbi:hypothetical protein D6764_01690 [Candidatus Woesearchaeota archaeon]|nr:MAG: hypothetical protein D6764_01690 [Candidatus Woesearchaeota archaeon]
MHWGYYLVNTFAPAGTSLIISLLTLLIVSDDYRTWMHSLLFIFLPGLFSMFFGDLMFVLAYLLQAGTLSGIRYASGRAEFVHDLFNTYADLISVPVTLLLVAAIVYLLSKRAKKEHNFPHNWVSVVFWVSLVNALVGTFIMDPLGF